MRTCTAWKLLLLCLTPALVMSRPAHAGEAAASQPVGSREVPCTGTEYRQLDFWLGEWEVTDARGTSVGRSRIESILNGCAIQENWEGANGWPGKSFNAYDRVLGQWRQFWVSSWGTVTVFLGEAAEDRMVYIGETVDREGRPVRRRMTLVRLGPNSVRQFTELSHDGGGTWQPDYDFTYTRGSAHCSDGGVCAEVR